MREFKSLRQKCKYIFFVVKTQVKSYILISQNVAFFISDLAWTSMVFLLSTRCLREFMGYPFPISNWTGKSKSKKQRSKTEKLCSLNLLKNFVK